MKNVFLILALVLSAAPAFAAAPDCREALRAYDAADSEAGMNDARGDALTACAREFHHQPKLAHFVSPLLRACDKIAEPTGGGDTGPHLVDSCRADAYRFGLHFQY